MWMVLLLVGLLLIFIGCPLSVIIAIVFKIKKKKVKVPIICIPASLCVGCLLILVGAFCYPEEEDKKTVSESEQESMSAESVQPVNGIFYGEIGLKKEQYKGEEVVFSFKCENPEDEELGEITTTSNLCYGSICVEFSEPQYVIDGSYITVKGVLGEEYSEIILKNAKIVSDGLQAEENYNKEFEEWENSFLQAEEVSCEQLLRYPDTYKNEKVKVNVDINEVETDGIIFNGTVVGVVPGTNDEIAFYDYRENREPRIKESDKLTIYGVGNGTLTVKVKNGNGFLAETVDKYDIPCIYIQFFDFR